MQHDKATISFPLRYLPENPSYPDLNSSNRTSQGGLLAPPIVECMIHAFWEHVVRDRVTCILWVTLPEFKSVKENIQNFTEVCEKIGSMLADLIS